MRFLMNNTYSTLSGCHAFCKNMSPLLYGSIFGSKIPSKEELENVKEKYHYNINKKKCDDCHYMINLLNKTLNDSMKNSNYKYITNKINLNKLNDISNINIKNCEGFDKYKSELNKRGIKLEINIDKYDIPEVDYNCEEKILTIITKCL